MLFFSISTEDRKKRKFNLERVGQYLQNENLQKASRLGVQSDWSNLLRENECLKNSGCVYSHNKELSLVQEHNNLKRAVNKLFEKPNILISLKFQRNYFLDVCEIDQQTVIHWHTIETEERYSTIFTATINDQMMHVIQYIPSVEYLKIGRFYFIPPPPQQSDESPSTSSNNDSLEERFPQMKLIHSQFYNEQIISILFSYQKTATLTSNSFIQFSISQLLRRLTRVAVKERMYFDLLPTPPFDLRELIDIDLVRSLDISDGSSLVVSGGRKIATIITNSRKKFYHFEMEVEEGDLDETDDDSKTGNESGKSSDQKDSSRSDELFNVSEASS